MHPDLEVIVAADEEARSRDFIVTVVWIIDAEQWLRAMLRAELIGRGRGHDVQLTPRAPLLRQQRCGALHPRSE